MRFHLLAILALFSLPFAAGCAPASSPASGSQGGASAPGDPVVDDRSPPPADAATSQLPGTALPANCTFETTPSGLKYAVLAQGSDGNGCQITDTVTVHYTGYLLDGQRFDGSQPGSPATFPAAAVIDGWQEALGMMTPGTKLKVVVPSKLAYGKRGIEGLIPPDSDLVFDMELVAVKAGPKLPQAPTPLPVPAFELPADSEMTATSSGLQHKVVTAGSGRTPAATDTVTVHYAGWLTDGTLFDNSYARGEPTSFPLNRVIRGWTEGLQLMQEGGTSIFMIPSDMAYGPGGAAGGLIPPNATLIFRVELLSVDS
jgi:peptidylprolyl isomerase